MNKKILAFIYNGEKFLLLRNNPLDKFHGGDYWFTVTGSIETNETQEEAITREIKEETNLNVLDIFDLKWKSIYSSGGEKHFESNFLVLVKSGKIKLNEENIDFQWLRLKEFVAKINWCSNKQELKQVLEKAIKKRIIFKKDKIENISSIHNQN